MAVTLPSWDEIYRQQLESLKAAKQSEKNAQNAIFDSQIASRTTEYERDVSETEHSFTDDYQRNAVQKLINEQTVAESMANLGLDNSGLSGVRKAGVRLSYANKKAGLDAQRKGLLDGLSASLEESLAEIERKRTKALSDIDKDYNDDAVKQANTIYKENLKLNK